MAKKKIFLFIGIALVVLAVAGAAVFLQFRQKIMNQLQGGNWYGNPAEKIPETNPFQTKTNPYQGGYKNPFSK